MHWVIKKTTLRAAAFSLLICILLLCRPLLADNGYGEISKSIVDSSGQTITIAKPFTRIISLYSAHTENLCTLGAGSALVGISRSDDYPPSIDEKPRFSYREDPEKFIALHPDLVLVRPMIERGYPEFINKLRKAGITVISLQPNSVKKLFGYWRKLGTLSGKESEAEVMIADFQSRLKVVQESLQDVMEEQRPKVYFQSIHTKMKTFAPESIAIFALEQAGGINIATDARQVRSTNIAFYGKEKLLSHGGEIDIFVAQHGRMNPVEIETIKAEPGFGAIRAVREGRVHLIKESLVSRPTVRILEGIEQLNNLFYQNTKQTLQSSR